MPHSSTSWNIKWTFYIIDCGKKAIMESRTSGRSERYNCMTSFFFQHRYGGNSRTDNVPYIWSVDQIYVANISHNGIVLFAKPSVPLFFSTEIFQSPHVSILYSLNVRQHSDLDKSYCRRLASMYHVRRIWCNFHVILKMSLWSADYSFCDIRLSGPWMFTELPRSRNSHKDHSGFVSSICGDRENCQIFGRHAWYIFAETIVHTFIYFVMIRI